jgi:hypothetical protein
LVSQLLVEVAALSETAAGLRDEIARRVWWRRSTTSVSLSLSVKLGGL